MNAVSGLPPGEWSKFVRVSSCGVLDREGPGSVHLGMLAKRYTSRKDRETGKLRSDTLHITDSDFDSIDSNCSPADSEANAVFAIVELHAACAVVDRIFLWLAILDAKFRHL